MKKRIILILTILALPVFGFEINTHQAITRCALAIDCGKKGADNLNFFARNMGIANEDFSKEIFEDYGVTYFNHAIKGDGLKDKLISFTPGISSIKNSDEEDIYFFFNDNSYLSLIEAGSILEDSLHSNSIIPLIRNGDGRFNNHFYSAQREFDHVPNIPLLGYTASLNTSSLRLSKRASFAFKSSDALGTRTDAISWALKENVTVGGEARKNKYTIHEAFKYFKDSFDDTYIERRKNQAKLFVALGHLSHLLEDLHSPAHVRNGAHAGGDYLEIFGRHNGGFLLREGKLDLSSTDSEIWNAVKNIDIKDIMLNQNKYSSYEDFFRKEALWVSENFFSESHDYILPLIESQDFLTGEGIRLFEDKCSEKDSTIFNIVPSPARSSTYNSEFSTFWEYIQTLGNNSEPDIKGDISTQTVLAFDRKLIDGKPSIFGLDTSRDCTTMSAPNGVDAVSTRYSAYNKKALKDTAINVIPRAVASVQTFINYFFRARIEAHINVEDGNGDRLVDSIIIKNTSEPSLVSSEELLTFKAGSTIKISYLKADDVTQEIKELTTIVLPSDLLVGEEYEIENLKELVLAQDINVYYGDNIIVLLEGTVGEKPLGSFDAFNINDTGLAVTYATRPREPIKITGQGVSIAPFDDGDYRKGISPSYNPSFETLAGTDVVYDRITGLYWHDPSDIPELAHLDAINYCENLDQTENLVSTINWRLPNIRELLTLNDVKLLDAIGEPPFKNNPNDGVYRSNLVDRAIDFIGTTGAIRSGIVTGDSSDLEVATRCVFGIGGFGGVRQEDKSIKWNVGRIIEPYNLVRDDTNGTVRDRSTGLMWQDDIDLENATRLSWEENLDYCESSDVGGYNDWRMPNLNELYTIIDHGDNEPVFQNTLQFTVSSTSIGENVRYLVGDRGNTIRAVTVPIPNPNGPGNITWEGRTRCVR